MTNEIMSFVVVVQPSVHVEHPEFTGMNDDEMLAAVLEMSRHDTGPADDEPTSSPDTGFGDTDPQELTQHSELNEADKPSGGKESFNKYLCRTCL